MSGTDDKFKGSFRPKDRSKNTVSMASLSSHGMMSDEIIGEQSVATVVLIRLKGANVK